jgi:hypothetical protein
MNAARDPWGDGMRAAEWLARWSRDGGDALTALSDIGQLRRLLDESELAAVRSARRQGKSWAEIATKLGVTRQSAWERWRDLDAVGEEAPLVDSILDSAAARTVRRRGQVLVPVVIGLAVVEARAVLADLGLVGVSADPDGRPLSVLDGPGVVVSDQSPESGARTAPGSVVRLWLRRDGGGAGVREPRRPRPTPQEGRKHQDDPATQRSSQPAAPGDVAGVLGWTG